MESTRTEDLGANTATAVATKPETETETGMADAEAKQKSIWDALMRQKDTNRNWNITRAKCPLTWPPYSKLKDVVLDKNFHKDLCMRSDLSARKRVLTPNGKNIFFYANLSDTIECRLSHADTHQVPLLNVVSSGQKVHANTLASSDAPVRTCACLPLEHAPISMLFGCDHTQITASYVLPALSNPRATILRARWQTLLFGPLWEHGCATQGVCVCVCVCVCARA